MPFFAPSVTTEADAAISFLEQQLTQLKYSAFELSDEQARSAPTASPLSISGLLIHGAQVVYGWLQQVKDPDRLITFDDFPTINLEIGIHGMYDGATLPDLDIAEVLVIFERAMDEVGRVREILASGAVGMDTSVRMTQNPWMPSDFELSVRWILAHLSTEVARHAGHADIIRESIDGAISYELNARAEGQPWPPAEWS